MALFAEHEAALPSWVGRTVINPRHIPLSREQVSCKFYAAIIKCIKSSSVGNSKMLTSRVGKFL